MSLCVPAWSRRSLHTPRGLQSVGQTCNSNFWLLWTLVRAANSVYVCVFVRGAVSGGYYRLCPCHSLLGHRGVYHLILVSTPIRLLRPSPAGPATQEAACMYVCVWLCALVVFVCVSVWPPAQPPSVSHSPLGTTLPIWTTIHHFHIVALMRKGLIIHVRGDKIRGEKINILWACQAHLSKPCVSLCGLWHRWLRGKLCSFSS